MRFNTVQEINNYYDVPFQERQTWQLLKRLAKRQDWLAIWKRQGGNCPVCKQRITKKMQWDIHYIQPKKEGGSDNPSNLTNAAPQLSPSST